MTVLSGKSMSVESCLELVHQALGQAQLYYGHGTDNAWDEACWLVESVLSRHGSEKFTSEVIVNRSLQVEIERLLLMRIEKRQPLGYLLGEAWFANMPFNVDERVLIPRSPIAELIVNQFQPLLKSPPRRVLDLCTGSGCIGIACATEFSEAIVDISDISQGALDVATSNIKKHKLLHRVNAITSDIFENVNEHYDLIVSNPPYVSKEEYQALPEEYLNEPEIALVCESDGLDLPLRIINEAHKYLNEGGILVLELGYSWQALAKRLPDLPILWLEFENGGEGVCMLTLEQLANHQL